MAIVVTNTYSDEAQFAEQHTLRHAQLVIAGLTAAAANTIPHGLPLTPRIVSLRPGASGLWGETSLPDATNLYVTVGTGGATAGTIDAWY